MGWGLGPDLGAGVQELTGPDAIPTVTIAAAAGDLSQILISGAAGTLERASALDRRGTPPKPSQPPTHGGMYSLRIQPCCADLLGTCGNTFSVHVAAPVADETAVGFWGKRHWDEGA